MTAGRAAADPWQRLKEKLLRRLDVLKPFDPWSSPMCTCPPKLALDPYCGCGYECLYCYVSAYNPRCWGWAHVRPKKELLRRLSRDIAKLREILGGESLSSGGQRLSRLPVAVSNSSDPYPVAPQADERELRLTRRALKVLAGAGFPLLVTTKSPLVVRDVDLFEQVPTVVAVTVTTAYEDLARRLEPRATPPRERIEAMRQIATAGVKVACRADPIIPGINDDERALSELFGRLAEAGVRRVIASTYKYKPDNFRRLAQVFPGQAERMRGMLDTSRRISGYWYLRQDVREELLGRAREIALRYGLSFSICREGLVGLSDGVCDARDLAGLSGRGQDRPASH